MIEINQKGTNRLARELDMIARFGVHYAQRDTINDMAFAAMRAAKGEIRENFINRNSWTVRSVLVERAKTPKDGAVVGSTEKYMLDQEVGAVGGSPRMATPAAAGQSNRQKVRTRQVRKKYRINMIGRVQKNHAGKSDQAMANIIAVKEAVRDGRKFVYQSRGARKGIYEIRGSRRKPRTRMVQDLSRRTRVVKPKPWLHPATDQAVAYRYQFFHNRLVQQLNRAAQGSSGKWRGMGFVGAA